MQAFLRFVLVGSSAFLIDAGMTQALIACGLSPLLARIPAILLAMAWTWQLNRRLTFRVQSRASLAEAGRYFTVAAGMALLNYAVYSALVALGLLPFWAIVLSTGMQTVTSFFAYRRFAFRQPAA